MANEMRDRLVELMKTANVYDGYDCLLCEKPNDYCEYCWAEKFADHLIENGVVVPPCKVGDTVYWLLNGKANECVVHCISQECFDDEITLRLHIRGKWCEIDLQPIYPFPDPMLFLTKEEAEQKLKEMRGGNADST